MKSLVKIGHIFRPWMVVAAAFAASTMCVKADVLTNVFTDSMVVTNGDISDFIVFATGNIKPGVCVTNDPQGIAEDPVDGDILLIALGSSHPDGFNQRRLLSAYNPTLNGGTLYLGVDLPGG